MSNSYPRESVEFIGVDLTINGVVQTATQASSIEVCVVPLTRPPTRPTSWSPIGTLNLQIGFLIGPGQAANDYSQLAAYPAEFEVWAQVTDSPEIPVQDCGSFRIT